MSAIFRETIPVSADEYPLTLSGEIVHVACRKHRHIDVWFIDGQHQPVKRVFRVYGTGHELPDHARHVRTVVDTDGVHVWHLFEHGSPG